ncbi:MAG: L,D-transpeptidase [Polyangiaceae bacterium]
MRGTLAFASCVTFATAGTQAEPLLRMEAGVSPSSEVSSVEVFDKDEPLYVRPSRQAARRGAAQQGSRLPIFASRRGAGCRGPWLMVGPLAWVCQDRVHVSSDPPVGARREPITMPEGLPYRYHFVGRNGALGYRTLSVAEETEPDAELQPGFAVGVVNVAKRSGEPFAFTTKGLWIPMRDLGPARALPLRGAELEGGKLDVAWVYEDRAAVYDKPGGSKLRSEVRPQWETLAVLDTVERRGHRWFRIGEQRWVSDEDVRAPTSAPPPAELEPGERWIDVDIKNQVLTAYEGERPVLPRAGFHGQGQGPSIPGHARRHPSHQGRSSCRATWTTWRTKRPAATTPSRTCPGSCTSKGYGLAVRWHRSFGRVRSHGCVNLTPVDAQRLFSWTGPHLPAGWSAVLPTEYDRRTLIRVR